MTKQVQRRRGTATQHTSFTGAEGEVSVNTTNKSVHVHDGVTAGGIEGARADLTNVSDSDLNARLTGNTLSSLTITSADINGGTIDGTVIGGTTPAAGNFTTGSFTGDVSFGDNDKAIFGAGSDLQIYHDGAHSYIRENGTGNLRVLGTDFDVRNSANTASMLKATDGGSVTINYDGSTKLATTSTGIDVTGTVIADSANITGTVTADGLTVDGSAQFNTGAAGIAEFYHSSGYGGVKVTGTAAASSATIYLANDKTGTPFDIYTIVADGSNDSLQLFSGGNPSTGTKRFQAASNGDISFYEDTGTTPKFHWSASAESLGIGTSSPTAVSGTTVLEITGTSGNAGAEVIIGSSDTTATANDLFGGLAFKSIDSNGTPPHYSGIKARAADTFGGANLEFYAGRSNYESNDPRFVIEGPQSVSGEAMRIDSSGNVGIGTSSPSQKLDVSGNARLVGSDPYLQILRTSDFYYGKVSADGFAAFTNTNGSAPVIFKAATSERMRIDSSGNVGIGTTSPSAALDVQSTDTFVSEFASTNASNTVETRYRSSGGVGSNTRGRIIGGYNAGGSGYGGFLAFNTTGTSNANAEAMRIDSSGNLLVGTTTSIGSNERLGVRSTTEAAQFENSPTGNGTVTAANTNTGYVDWIYTATTARGGSTSCGFFRGIANSSINIYIYNNGNIVNANNSYGAISDVKLKENITDATPKLSKLNEVRVVNYNLIGHEQKQIGVIAQELEEIFPSMVEETADRDEEGNDLGTTTKSVKYSVFVPMLIKAIQEQQAAILNLETRITALEA